MTVKPNKKNKVNSKNVSNEIGNGNTRTTDNKTNSYKKILEINKDNINAILLELKKNKKQLNINIKNIISFLLRNYETPDEILCKLKIIHDKTYFENIYDNILQTIMHLTETSNKIPLGIEYIVELDYFSRVVCLWYFSNRELSDEENLLYTNKMIEMMYKLCKVNVELTDDVNQYSREEVELNKNEIEISNDKKQFNKENNELSKDEKNRSSETIKNVNQENTKSIDHLDTIELEDLEDSAEIERINTNLGKLFKKPMSKLEKQKVAKFCDILELIIQKNVSQDIFLNILPLLDVDELLYKKIFGLVKYSSDENIFIECLKEYKNTWRNINFIYDKIGMLKVFECANENEFSTFEYLDRSKIYKTEFYEFIFNHKIENVFDLLILHFLKTENDKKIIEQIKGLECGESVSEMCDIRLGKT